MISITERAAIKAALAEIDAAKGQTDKMLIERDLAAIRRSNAARHRLKQMAEQMARDLVRE